MAMASPRIVDWSASADRIEEIANCLTDGGRAVDRAAAARAAEYCRRQGAGEPEDEPAFLELTEFVRAHGQSLDRIFFGTQGG